ncbi:MAG: TlpA family protein disulfide reductase [Acidobacteriota bacterium]|nr:TlpA family protein disulfide reductase [Acidobacteriota bacterium]
MLRRIYMPLTAALAGAALVALLVFGVLALGSNRTLDEAVAAGRRPLAPAYTRAIPVLNGSGRASLAGYRGHVVLLNFWASWCPPCQQEAPLIESAQRQLERHGATVLGVSYKDAAADAESFMRRNGLTFPDLRDVAGEYAEAFGTAALPESFLLDRTGRIVALSRGEIEAGFVHRAVALAQSG